MADTPTIPTIDTSASVENLQKLDAATKSAAQNINYASAEANLAQQLLIFLVILLIAPVIFYLHFKPK